MSSKFFLAAQEPSSRPITLMFQWTHSLWCEVRVNTSEVSGLFTTWAPLLAKLSSKLFCWIFNFHYTHLTWLCATENILGINQLIVWHYHSHTSPNSPPKRKRKRKKRKTILLLNISFLKSSVLASARHGLGLACNASKSRSLGKLLLCNNTYLCVFVYKCLFTYTWNVIQHWSTN